jgi:type VI secretion system secreted protein VgrG
MSSSRTITITTPLADGTLSFEHMAGWEALGKPFEYQVDLLSKSADVDVAAVLGKPMSIELSVEGGSPRHFHGITARFGQVGNDGEHIRYRATLRPWLWLLTRTSNCRIFQGGKTVVDIVKQVFSDAGFSDFDASRLSDSYRPWDFLVQYRETDFNFVSRILEQEGIYYYFTHKADKHTLVLADASGSHDKTPGYETIPYFPPAGSGGQRDRDHIDRWSFAGQVVPGKIFLDDFNFETPRGDRKSPASSPRPGGYADFEMYNYPGEFKDRSEGGVAARVGLERQQSDYEVFEGAGDARGLSTGALFSLSGYFRADQDKEYLVTSSSYVLNDASYVSGVSADSDYRISFTAVDAGSPFRAPAFTQKPTVQGPQTAIVVGPKGEEIWTDKYGRVKVQFHWDRYGASDENSSCWVRVAQVWAGAKWGAMHIPRMGQEVIVDFLEGDPDRPIITGRVYNADNMPPYDLPANQTQSGIKSRSSKGGSASNFNEIRFEDKKGSEELFVQAEKDQNTLVKHDQNSHVQNDQTLTVDANRTKSVGKDESVSIGANRTETVGKDESVTISGSRDETVAKNESVTVGATRTLTVAAADSTTVGGAHSLTVGGSDSVTVGGAQSLDVAKDRTVTVGGAQSVDIGKDGTVTVGAGRKVNISKDDVLEIGGKLSINVATEISIKTGDAVITMKKNGDITLKGKNITLEGSGKIKLGADGDLIMKGSKISEN